jgi:sialic acid synthase SpsE
MRSVRIRNKVIGNRYPAYIIAEIGGNFKTFEIGKKLIQKAIENGADCVKIQTFTAEKLVSKNATFDLPVIGGKKNQFKILKKLELDSKVQKKLFDYCKKKKITIFSTPSHKKDVDFLEENNVCAYKLGSDDLTNLPLIKYVSKCGKPTIISTGMSNMKEVKEAVKTFYSTGNKNLILLHCVSMYPYEPEFTNLRAISTMQNEFQIPVGWSDHSKGIDVCLAAATLGANIIEKHFMLNKKSAGPDKVLSADPEQLSRLVKSIRVIEKAKGNGVKRPAKCELSSRRDIRKSIIASENIKKGTKITFEKIDIKRPGYGLSPKLIPKIIGKTVKRNILKDRVLKLSDIF